MDIDILGDAAAGGWPAAGCRCASCAALRRDGRGAAALRVLVDGVPLDALPRRDVAGGFEATAPDGSVLLVAARPGDAPEPSAGVRYSAVLLDLVGRPEHLGRLRRAGAVGPATRVHAVHLDHRTRSRAELDRLLRHWLAPVDGPHRTLLLGGSRSGKSREAELRLAAEPAVTYVATGRDGAGDAEWAARIAAHRERRPAWWTTVETNDVAAVLRAARGAVLVDGLGSWLTGAIDAADGWSDPARAAAPRVADLVAAWRETAARVVAVSDEVGLSVVPATASGRAFRDLLGELNRRLAAESEDAALVVAGRVLDLP
ncbi:bifunctional adenosylcobinamide kinase/adenosylcobinamide-phosphate guanylyltransferase [Actinomadura atramentaria]|uniref:bifunctional adenosylcobinamide kinase/adenosylcobinamide-phosphate guanylyltransferase n=1 Tax=Actinomadura atramentaria TaxID=1990 RepID=UPI00037D74BE|nr:bifunctional adenosylcobinamide kinase/adenosylcobinamide-phosphate guanylyltransferase [Actinomadura atramentaria]